jgi:hypothetical protein
LQPANAANPGVITTGVQTIAGAKTFTGAISASNLSGNNTGDVTLAAVGAVPVAAGASLVGQVLTLQPANAANPGVMTILAQTIAGAKTFTGAISASNLSGTNTGDVTLTAVGAVPAATGASLVGQAITLQPASNAFPGVITTGAQTFAGDKTFNGVIAATNLSGTNTGDVTTTLASTGGTSLVVSGTGPALTIKGLLASADNSALSVTANLNDLTIKQVNSYTYTFHSFNQGNTQDLSNRVWIPNPNTQTDAVPNIGTDNNWIMPSSGRVVAIYWRSGTGGTLSGGFTLRDWRMGISFATGSVIDNAARNPTPDYFTPAQPNTLPGDSGTILLGLSAFTYPANCVLNICFTESSLVALNPFMSNINFYVTVAYEVAIEL